MVDRRAFGYAAIAVLVAGGTGWFVWHDAAAAPPGAVPAPTGTARVTRTDVAVRTLVVGYLDYGDRVNLPAAAPGVLTWLPAVGTVVHPDQRLYEVDGQPVLLWTGDRPAWRDFAPGMPDGPDVAQLERNLVALGFGAGVTVDNHFSAATATAVRRWQSAHGLPRTGVIPLGQVVFRAAAVRVGALAAVLGASLAPGVPVLTVTATTTAVTVNLDPARAGTVHTGDPVTVMAAGASAGGGTVPGKVAVVGTAVAPAPAPGGGNASGGGDVAAPTVPLTIAVDDPGGRLGVGPVQVAITSTNQRGVLAVPIDALLAAPGGGYQVAVRLNGQRQLVPVRTGLVDESDGLVAVDGVPEGTIVEVPAS
jgi:peptidoglycan hydrolase-like protein with peptidoglycan-binding domain